MDVKKKKILIIDDDSRNIFALKAVLTAKKYTCLVATSAQEGFNVIQKNDDVGVVLLDMMMPEMDGYEALAKREKEPALKKIPVIAVTAQAMTGDRERCLQAGANGYISKPVNVEDLVNLLEAHL